MSFSTKCHLSGLIINNDNDVIYIPVQYSTIETVSMCYTTSLSISPFYTPIFGKYNDYGSLIPEKDHKNIKNFRDFIELKLKNKTIAFLKDEYNGFKKSEFISDQDIINFFSDSNSIPEMSLSHLNDEDFLSEIQNLFSFNCGSAVRFGYILIKKDFLDSYIQNQLKKEFSLIEENLNRAIFEDKEKNEEEDEEDYLRRNKFLNSYEISKLLLFFNDEDLPLYNAVTDIFKYLRQNRDNLIKNEVFNNFIKTLTYFGIIYHIYRTLGKSFYPVVNSRYSNKPVYEFNKFFISYLDNQNKKNEDDYAEHKWFI